MAAVEVLVGVGVAVEVLVGVRASYSTTSCGLYEPSRVPKPRQLESSPETSGPRSIIP